MSAYMFNKLGRFLISGEEEATLYKARMSEIVPNLRFCAYNSGDEVAKQELMSMRGGGAGNVDELINQAKQEQAATLQEVEWRGRKMAVRQEQVRLFLLREQEFDGGELENARTAGRQASAAAEAHEAVVEAYESLLMDCKDAVQALKADLVEDPVFRNRQQVSEGPVSASHFLHTYLSFIKCSRTVERSLAMIANMTEALEAGTAVGGDPKKKPVRAQDLVRLYETVMQNLNEMPQLAGLEEDLAFRQEVEAKTVYYKACRCFFIAQAFMAAQKWPEAMALFQRATSYATKAKGDKILEQGLRGDASKLVESVESKQFMAHANSILDDESKGKGKDGGGGEITEEDKKKALIDRLDVYYEDPKLLKGTKERREGGTNMNDRIASGFKIIFRQTQLGALPSVVQADTLQATVLRPCQGATHLPQPRRQARFAEQGQERWDGWRSERRLAWWLAWGLGRQSEKVNHPSKTSSATCVCTYRMILIGLLKIVKNAATYF